MVMNYYLAGFLTGVVLGFIAGYFFGSYKDAEKETEKRSGEDRRDWEKMTTYFPITDDNGDVIWKDRRKIIERRTIKVTYGV